MKTVEITSLAHENCHSYIHEYGGWDSEAIYTGNGQHIVVDYTDENPFT